MNRLLLIIVAMLCLPAFTQPIQACECREYRTPICAQFWRSDAVFVGQVLDTLKNDGSFKFERVAPGEYHLVLNARHEVPEAYDAPYARTYYPATTDKRQAKKIQVFEGALIENLVMRVGPRMTERSVAGTVVWKSGRRLENAHVSVYSGNKYVRWVSIDEDGRFKCVSLR